jgi:hypothetical protein
MRPSSANQSEPPPIPGGMTGYPPQPGMAGQYGAPQPAMSTTESIAYNHPYLNGEAAPGQHAFDTDVANMAAPKPPDFAAAQQQGTVVAGGPGAPANPGVKPAGPRTNPNSTQNMLQFAEIRDGIIIMHDGTFRSVVMVKSINFDLMSQSEQESVEYSFQGFLNSLYFPIQIFIRSQKIDLRPYLERLEKIRSEHDNMLLATLMEDYIEFMGGLAQETNIMDKKFYIVIPFEPKQDVQKALTNSKNFLTGVTALFNTREDHIVINEAELEKAKTELRNRVQAVLSGLMQSNVQSIPLDTQELIELLYDTYNPDTATQQQIKDFDNLTAEIVTKGQGSAPQAHLQRELQ